MIRTYSKDQLDAMIAGGLTGPQGPPGVGVPAYTTTSAGFTQPASGANVTVSVGDTSWMSPGQELYVATGGYYAVSSITNATTVVLTNSGYPVNASPGATINSGSKVSPGGIQGPSGASGAYSTIQEDGSPLTQRTTLNFGSNITAADNSGSSRTDVSVPSASDTTPGVVELATDGETQTGTDTARAVTPANLTARSATETRTGVAEIATQAEADAGTDDVRIMTPLKVATRPQKNSVFETHIQGLQLTWNTPGNNGNLLTVSSGSAWIQSLGRVYNVPSTITGPTQTLTASAWNYVYLYDNSGTPAVEINTTAPAAPYKGNARSKTGDASRRFIGQVLADATGTPVMRQFAHIGSEDMIYPASTLATPFRIINGVGPGASQVTQSLAAICPPGVTTQICATMTVGIGATGGNTFLELQMIGAARVGIAGGMISTANGFLFTAGWFPVNSTTPDVHYSTTGPAGSAFYLDIVGYKFVR